MDPVQIIDADGNAVVDKDYWIERHADIGPEVPTVISILGAQASGKSTLLNTIFAAKFPVASRSSVGSASTKGIYASPDSENDLIIALDVEGSDSRERGRDGRVFHSRLAAFVTAISDVIVINLWYHDLGRFDASGYTLLRDIFTEAVKLAEDDSDSFRTRLVFTVRDVDSDVTEADIASILNTDIDELFNDVDTSLALRDMFDITFVPLPHMRHSVAAFTNAVRDFARRLKSQTDNDGLLRTEYSKGIPADGCGTFTRRLWESHYASKTPNAATDSAEGGVSLIAAYKCNEAFSEALADANSTMKSYASDTIDVGDKIDDLGSKSEEILNKALKAYDDATVEYKDESIQSRKRRELESIIDTAQQAMFMKQIQVLRENALTHFKSATSSDDMPSDLAFYTADSLFQRGAEASKRPGSSWNANQERTDLQNKMQEISTQRKRLLTSQVSAAQDQTTAMQLLQMQQSQMNAIQAQAYGGGLGQWNLGAAYRPPDTNINASLSYQQGRTNIQISMVPDESASLLGPNGFTSGVGPGNLGLSFNIGL